MLLVFISPVSGWKKLKSSEISADNYASNMFYPLLALTSASVFFEKFHSREVELQSMLIQAIACFATYFFSYFIIQMLCRLLFTGDKLKEIGGNFGKIFCMTILATLCIYMLVENIIPMLGTILVFLPIYTIYIMYKGFPILLLPKFRTQSTLFFLIGLNIIIPFLIFKFLTSIL